MSEIVDSNSRRFGCVHCSQRWGGFGQAHCATCHQTFSTVSLFDLHRRGPKGKPSGECYPPAEVGLALRDGIWRSPKPERDPWAAKRGALTPGGRQ